jgi:hypothetical protein
VYISDTIVGSYVIGSTVRPEYARPVEEPAVVFIAMPGSEEPIGDLIVQTTEKGTFVLEFDRGSIPVAEADLVVKYRGRTHFREPMTFKRLSMPPDWIVVLKVDTQNAERSGMHGK